MIEGINPEDKIELEPFYLEVQVWNSGHYKMKIFQFFITLAMADLISFNRLRNNVMKHTNTSEKRGKVADYYRLQMMLAKMKRGNVDFAKKMLKSIEKEISQDNNDSVKKQNFRLTRYLEYWTCVNFYPTSIP